MAKNRKTKKEKIRTATRVVQPSVTAPSSSESTPLQGSVYSYISPSTPPATLATGTHSLVHLREDLTRTCIVIGAIIIAEITLFFALTGM